MAQFRRLFALTATGTLVAASAVLTQGPVAVTQPEGISVELSSVDGSAPFDDSTEPGHDDGPDNGIVRANDFLTYSVAVTNSREQAGLRLEVTLPQGTQMQPDQMPAICQPGSTPPSAPTLTTASYSATAMPDPMDPAIAPPQTFVCVLPALPAGETASFPVTTRVLPGVPTPPNSRLPRGSRIR